MPSTIGHGNSAVQADLQSASSRSVFGNSTWMMNSYHPYESPARSTTSFGKDSVSGMEKFDVDLSSSRPPLMHSAPSPTTDSDFLDSIHRAASIDVTRPGMRYSTSVALGQQEVAPSARFTAGRKAGPKRAFRFHIFKEEPPSDPYRPWVVSHRFLEMFTVAEWRFATWREAVAWLVQNGEPKQRVMRGLFGRRRRVDDAPTT